jgi:phosphoribosylglycinamide formyltransferase-1
MISGGGRTLLNLLDACERGEIPATIPVVIASTACAGAERARARGLHVVVAPGAIPRASLATLLEEFNVGWVALAGYLRLLAVPREFEGRVANIHPALLPDFGGPGMYGHHVHEAVLASRARESGCTVHLCDEQYDHGPIVLRRRCPVLPGDTPETLAARVFAEECLAYPQALRMLITGEWTPGMPPVEIGGGPQ